MSKQPPRTACDHAVVIAGAGPAGLMLAAELALAGVDAAIVERRPSQALAGTRAGGLHPRTLEVLDQRGVADRFIAEGQKAQATGFAGVHFDLAGFPTRHPYSLGLRQNHIERILAAWVAELEVPIHYGLEVAGLAQDEAGVDVRLSGGSALRARYLVGCDGGRSLVRKAAGIAFEGSAPSTSNIIAQVELADPPPQWGIRRDAIGTHAIAPVEYEIRDGAIVYADHGPIGVLVTEKRLSQAADPTLDELKAALTAAYGSDFGVHSPTWISRFTDAARQAAAYRKGRVLLAGDAAHIHPPDGGQGLQTGVQDAVNLGWKLAQVVKGTSPETLLDSYHQERHPVGARVLRNTLAAVVLRREDERTGALRETLAELLALDEPRRRFTAMMSGLDIHYDLGTGHPLLGRRIPDLDLITEDGPQRLYTLLHAARPLLLDLGNPGGLDITPWAGRVRRITARHDGPWELPALGEAPAPAAVLVRPDGHVAWVGEGGETGLKEALARWFGPSAASTPSLGERRHMVKMPGMNRRQLAIAVPALALAPARASSQARRGGQMLEWSAGQAVAAMRSGDVSAEAYADALLARCGEARALNAFITLDPDKVREAARAADRRRASGERLGPLHGLPIPIKDSINTTDLPTTAGTPALRGFRPGRDAPVVERLRTAGAFPLGKTNLHELSFGWTSNNAAYGAVRNPYDPARIPGGSSGGTASAVAARMAPLGLAEDTQGSIRIPAALCGLTALRPTTGRYPSGGVAPITPVFDQVGPHARTVSDLVLFDALFATDPAPVVPAALRGLRLGLSRGFHFQGLDPEVARVVEAAIDRLRAAGVTFVEAELAGVPDLTARITGATMLHDAGPAFAAWLREGGAQVDWPKVVEQASPDVRGIVARTLPGAPGAVTEEAFAAARDVHLPALRKLYADYFRQNAVAAILFPATLTTAPLIGQSGRVPFEGGGAGSFSAAVSRNITAGSTAGLPGLVIPAGLSKASLPVGVELDAPAGSDRALLAIGLALETVLPPLPPPRL